MEVQGHDVLVRHYMAESGKFHDPSFLSPGNNPAVSVGQESGSAQVSGCCGQETVSPAGNRTPAIQPVARRYTCLSLTST